MLLWLLLLYEFYLSFQVISAIFKWKVSIQFADLHLAWLKMDIHRWNDILREIEWMRGVCQLYRCS